ncbi:MAG: hypothetical protein ABW328_15965 [Ilumatobacteraceae bacterium]
MIDRTDVLTLLTAQRGVAAVAQLLELGISRRTVIRARRRGTVVSVLPGVVRMAASPDTFESRAMALQLHTAPTGFLSGVTAGTLHGLRQMPRVFLEVTVPEDRQVVMPSWGRLHRSSWIDGERDIDAGRADGFRVASPLRTMFRLASVFNDHRFERAAEDAWHRGLVTPEQAADYLVAIRRSGRTGVARFERWLEKTAFRSRPSQSGLELDVLDAIRRAGLPEPQRQHPLTLRTGEVIHIDLAWPNVRLGVEPGHSWWHGGDLRKRADEARDRACDEIGWRIVRHDESVREELAAFGLQLRIIHDERVATLRSAQARSL